MIKRMVNAHKYQNNSTKTGLKGTNTYTFFDNYIKKCNFATKSP